MEKCMKVVQIVAVSMNGVIGNGDNIPWRLPADLMHFKSKTLRQVCVVGRKTYNTISHLKDRHFVVITSDPCSLAEGIVSENNIEDAIETAKNMAMNLGNNRVMVIGGSAIYRETFKYATKLIVTMIEHPFDGDCRYEIPSEFKLVNATDLMSDNNLNYFIAEYEK